MSKHMRNEKYFEDNLKYFKNNSKNKNHPKTYICPRCDQKFNRFNFRDKFSLDEFKRSGLCQNCQDSIEKEFN